jgi:hypothetical protein
VLQSELFVGADTARALRAVVMLAGRVGRDRFADGVDRSVLDLPLDHERTVMTAWAEQFADLVRSFDLPRLEVRVAVNPGAAAPRTPPPSWLRRVEFIVERDASAYRGTAGVVRDFTRDYDDRDMVLVVTAGQVQREPLRDVFGALARCDEGVSLVPHAGGEFAGMFLLRCGRLRGIPEIGFVDMKEQAIPSTVDHEPLRVARRPAGSAFPLRTREEYLRALRALHADAGEATQARSAAPVEDPFAETWRSVFSIVEPGADVAEGAILQNSVVLAGGRVGERAVVADSIVCRDGVVAGGRCVVGEVISGDRS